MMAEKVLQEMTRRLVDRFRPVAVILFGSQARGTADERSDVDLLVLRRIGTAENRGELVTEMHRSMRGVPAATDIVLMTPDEFEYDRDIPGQLARYAAREGRVLYGAA